MARALSLAFLLCIFSNTAVAHVARCEGEMARKVGLDNPLGWVGKTVLLDTNILLKDPLAFLKFPGAHIIMTGTVFEEIDAKKSHPKLGVAAREFSRSFLSFFDGADSPKEVKVDDHGTRVTFDLNSYTSELNGTSLNRKLPDNQILAATLAHMKQHGGRENVILISDDNNMRMKSIGLGIQARAFANAGVKVEVEAENEKLTDFEITDDQMSAFLNERALPLPAGLRLAPNEFIRFKSPSIEAGDSTVGRFHFDRKNPDNKLIKPLPEFARMGLPALPRNLQQAMALDVLLDETVDCVILEAKAGTGKTFIALLAAWYYLKKVQNYGHVRLTKPTAYVGDNDPGALPGGIGEKYQEWMKSYLNNLSKIFHLVEQRSGKGKGKGKHGAENPNYVEMLRELPDDYELEPFEFLRGRTFDDSFAVLDEAQNTKVVHMKTFLTRAGERAKMVIMGDTTQIDLDERQVTEATNGLSHAIREFLGPEIPMDERSRVARIRLTKGERSPFANMAADRL